jgi:hypothetical protein
MLCCMLYCYIVLLMIYYVILSYTYVILRYIYVMFSHVNLHLRYFVFVYGSFNTAVITSRLHNVER